MKVFKYSKLSFFKKASFRLGTLYDYRDQEKYGKNIGDPKEGHFKAKFDYKDDFSISDEELEVITAQQDFGYAWVRGHTQNKSHDFIAFTPSNLLVFSTTLTYDENLLTEFDDSNLCYEITDFYKFSEAIIQGINLPVKKWAINKCIYKDKEILNSYKAIPSLTYLKEPKYSPQQEVRLCVELDNNNATPLIIKSKKALKYCKRRKVR